MFLIVPKFPLDSVHPKRICTLAEGKKHFAHNTLKNTWPKHVENKPDHRMLSK